MSGIPTINGEATIKTIQTKFHSSRVKTMFEFREGISRSFLATTQFTLTLQPIIYNFLFCFRFLRKIIINKPTIAKAIYLGRMQRQRKKK